MTRSYFFAQSEAIFELNCFPAAEKRITFTFSLFIFNFKLEIARTSGSSLTTIPGPPPYGRSSTFLCLSRENSLRSCTRTSITRFARARFIIDSPKYELNVDGNMVIISKRIDIGKKFAYTLKVVLFWEDSL